MGLRRGKQRSLSKVARFADCVFERTYLMSDKRLSRVAPCQPHQLQRRN